MQVDPDRIRLDVNLAGTSDPFRLEPDQLDEDLVPPDLGAYARLLLGAFEGDPTFSIGAREAERSWEIVEPVLDAWEAGDVPLEEYPAGSEGP
jgi:glucose-6-phosphate 1-dehydrogenase